MDQRKQYSKEFKEEAVRLAAESKNKSGVARDLGINLSMLRRWEQEAEQSGEKAFPGKGNPKDEEMAAYPLKQIAATYLF
ncbi:transposase [Rhodocytophaga aerolata]|uniref:Transposase n=1 Tax=Rhodocytophaga aerolata TaxID=455078 RepID=A0ABT8REW9_9BACT|nr:transposase [Rhodocytophaga aerolata]MDO1450662.1 transposase [Rhodocytophaga aerolata]